MNLKLGKFFAVAWLALIKTGGFGVGLAIADRAVRLHGGSIVVTNRPDGGLVVRMRFPIA